MELTTKKYLEDSIKSYDAYRGLNKIGKPNGIATLDENGKVTGEQLPADVATLDEDGKVPVSELPDTLVYKDSTGKISKDDLPDGIGGGIKYNDTEMHYIATGNDYVTLGNVGDTLKVSGKVTNIRVSNEAEASGGIGNDPYIQAFVDDTESAIQIKAGDGIEVANTDANTITITNTKSVEISEEEGNAIVEKEDGIYVPVSTTEISSETGNIIEMKDDGIYATAVTEISEAIESRLAGLKFTISGSTLTITDGTNTWTLNA